MNNNNTDIETIFMDHTEWSAIPDNPIQRDTIRHATRASAPGKHLSKMHETHRNLAAARLPTGKLIKLDGHSRSWLWDEELLSPPPAKLIVTVYPVKNKAEAIDYYRTFDNAAATETKRDRLFGAFRMNKFYPHHGYLFNSSGLMSAIEYTVFPDNIADMRKLPFDEMVKPWISTLQIFDSGDFTNHYAFRSAVMLAAIMTIRRDGNSAMSFWQAYHDNGGSKSAKSADGIYLATDCFRTMKLEAEKKWGRRMLGIYTPYLLLAYDSWATNTRLKPFGSIMNKRLPQDMFSVREWWSQCLGDTDQQHLVQQKLDLV